MNTASSIKFIAFYNSFTNKNSVIMQYSEFSQRRVHYAEILEEKVLKEYIY